MQKFSEFVNDYKKYRESQGLSSEITLGQVKQIRELYESMNSKKNKIAESEEKPVEEKDTCNCDCGDPDCKCEEKENTSKTFEEALAEYREKKFQEKGTRGVTMQEKEEIRASLEKKEPMKESFDKCDACGDECPKSFDVKEFLASDASSEYEKSDLEGIEPKDVIESLNETGYVKDLTEDSKLCPDCILKGIDGAIDKKKHEEFEKDADEISQEGDRIMDEMEIFDESIEGFKKVVAQFREWKKSKYNTTKLTEGEKEVLKAKFLEKVAKLKESKEAEVKPEENTRLNESIAQFKEWKKANHGTDEISKLEEEQIKVGLLVDDITAKLEEAKKFVESGRKHLTEGDVMDAGADAQAAAGAVNDASAMADPAMAGDPNAAVDPNAGVALPQNIIDEISQIKTSIDALATECGIESPVDLGADASAGVPAVTGAVDPNVDATAGAVDPNAAPAPDANAAPLPESIKSVKARIAARNAALKETVKFSNTKMTGDKDTVKIPSESELVNGTGNISANVKKATWPVKDVKPSDTKKLKNIEECTQEDLAKMTLSEDGEFSWSLYSKMLKNM